MSFADAQGIEPRQNAGLRLEGVPPDSNVTTLPKGVSAQALRPLIGRLVQTSSDPRGA